jgi:hypothetical protein
MKGNVPALQGRSTKPASRTATIDGGFGDEPIQTKRARTSLDLHQRSREAGGKLFF